MGHPNPLRPWTLLSLTCGVFIYDQFPVQFTESPKWLSKLRSTFLYSYLLLFGYIQLLMNFFSIFHLDRLQCPGRLHSVLYCAGRLQRSVLCRQTSLHSIVRTNFNRLYYVYVTIHFSYMSYVRIQILCQNSFITAHFD